MEGSIMNVIILLIVLAITSSVTFVVYALYLHPLSRFPGPKTWILIRLPLMNALKAGRLVHRIASFHEQYGPIVRIGYNDLSFVEADAWNDIYSTKAGFEKNPVWNGIRSIITASKADHPRYRRLLSHGFSDKALRAQEPIIQRYISLFIAKLKEEMEIPTKTPSTKGMNDTSQIGSNEKVELSKPRPINIMKWYEYVIFDLLGDLSFSRSFHSLEDPKNRPFVSGFIQNIQAVTHLIATNFMPALRPLFRRTIPKNLMASNFRHDDFVRSQVWARAAEGYDTSRPDFMSYLLRHNTDDSMGMSMPEIESNFATILIAGSETTATALSGITHELVNHPQDYEKLVNEIRSTFTSELDITVASTSKLPYLNAVIEEGLRYCAPAAGFGFRVVPPQGGMVCGHWLHGGTSVCVNQFACFRSPLNFSEPNSFIPKRWISPEKMAVHEARALNAFSLGNRNCIGKFLAYAELHLMLARVLWNFDIVRLGEDFDWAEQNAFLLWEKRSVEVGLKVVER